MHKDEVPINSSSVNSYSERKEYRSHREETDLSKGNYLKGTEKDQRRRSEDFEVNYLSTKGSAQKDEGYHFLEPENSIRKKPLEELVPTGYMYHNKYSTLRDEEKPGSRTQSMSKESNFSFESPSQKQQQTQTLTTSQRKIKEISKFPKANDAVYGLAGFPDRRRLEQQTVGTEGSQLYEINESDIYVPDSKQQDVTAFWKSEDDQHLSLEFQPSVDTYVKTEDYILSQSTGRKIPESYEPYRLATQEKHNLERPQLKEQNKAAIKEYIMYDSDENLADSVGEISHEDHSEQKIMTGKDLKEALYCVQSEDLTNDENPRNKHRNVPTRNLGRATYRTDNVSANKQSLAAGPKQIESHTENSSGPALRRGLKTEMPLYLSAVGRQQHQ